MAPQDPNLSVMEREKKMAGQAAAALVEDGQRVGLGSGSTMRHALEALAGRWQDGLRFVGTPTSERTRAYAEQMGFPLRDIDGPGCLDLAIDGADEISEDWTLIKGGGGALLREKLVASAARRFIVVADHSKRVVRLGRHPVPVEVAPFAWKATAARIEALGGRPVLRLADAAAPFVTDNGHYILDVQFGLIDDPTELHAALKALPGVMETGLFIGMATDIVVGTAGGPVWLTGPRPQ